MNIENDNQQVFYCEDGGEYRVYCKIFDTLFSERFLKKKHLKSQTGTNIIRKIEQLNKYIQIIPYNWMLISVLIFVIKQLNLNLKMFISDLLITVNPKRSFD